MPAIQRYTNLAAVVLPFLAFIAALGLLWNSAIGWSDLAILLAMYLVSAFGITIGYHRLLTHRAFQTYKPLEYALAIAGSMAVQGPWQIEATRLPASKNAFTNATASGCMRSASGLMTPPATTARRSPAAGLGRGSHRPGTRDSH